MEQSRFEEIWKAVVVNAFYCVGGIDDGGGSDVSHEEMVEIMKMAKDALDGNGRQHLRVWWPENGKRLSGIVLSNAYTKKDAMHLHVKLDGSNETRFIDKKSVDANEWVDDPKKGY